MARLSTSEDFIAEYGYDTFERIFEVIIGDAKHDDITLMDVYMRDAANHYGWVVFRTPSGDEIICNFENGNLGGSEITAYGKETEAVLETIVIRRFVLDENRILREGKRLDVARIVTERDKAKIAEKERAYNYDITFEPTTKTNQHYRDWMNERYLTIETEIHRGRN